MESSPPLSETSPPKRAQKLAVRVGRGVIALVGFGVAATWLGEGYWVLELSAFWIPLYTALAFMGTALCMAGGARRSAVAGLVAGLIAAAHLVPLQIPRAGAASTGARANFRLLTANVYEKNWNRAAFPRFATQSEADVVIMQEVDLDWHNRMLALNETYPEAMHTSRWPGDKMDLGEYGKQAPVEVELADALDLPATVTTYAVNGQPVRLMNIHTRSPYTTGRARQHEEEFEKLTAWVKETDGPLIVAGDFNSTPWSPLFRKLLAETRLQQARQGFGVVGSWPTFFGPVRTPIDHVLVTPDIGVVNFRLGPPVGSDHRPLVVDLHISSGADDRKKP
jgi:endonuclease/exonuclease/phosphatase (EEP) superfamily protein YafD